MSILGARRRLSTEGLRFLAAGMINSAATFTIYWVLLGYKEYRFAYTAAYACGIVLSYVLNSLFVFGTRPGLRSAAAFPLVYLLQYLIGLAVLWVWVSLLHLPPAWGVVVTTLVSIPFTFVLSRTILRKLQ